MNDKQQYDLQELLKKKQKFIQDAIKEIQRNDISKAINYVNFDAGFSGEIIKILENSKDSEGK